MRIAWFTPLSVNSAIGQYSATVVDHLSVSHDVTVYSPRAHGTKNWPVRCPVRSFAASDSAVVREIDGYDLVVYNLGDHVQNHQDIYEVSKMRSGVVILHDLVMHHFFAGYFWDVKKDPEEYEREIRYSHGEEGAEIAARVRRGVARDFWMGAEMLRFHMAPSAVRGAYGVVVHSEFARKALAHTGDAPVVAIDFPAPAVSNGSAGGSAKGDRVSLLTFGVINPNKMVREVIMAIAGSERLRNRVRYDIVGEAGQSQEYVESLHQLVRDSYLSDVIHFHGRQSPEVLQELLRNADIVLNLRNPHYGESSWSLLESLLLGKTTVVWKHGFYDEISGNAVVKITAAEDLERALEALVASPKDRAAIGRRAGDYARSRFNTEKYCKTLLSFVGEARYYRPFLDLASTMRLNLDAFGPEQAVEVRRLIRDEISAMIGRRLDVPADPGAAAASDDVSRTAQVPVPEGASKTALELERQIAELIELTSVLRVREEEAWRREIALQERVSSFHAQVVELLERESEAWKREVGLRKQLEEARVQLADLHASFVELSSRSAELQRVHRLKTEAVEADPTGAPAEADRRNEELREKLDILSGLLQSQRDFGALSAGELRYEVGRVREAETARHAELLRLTEFHADLVRTRGWRVLEWIRRVAGRRWR